MKKDTVAPAVDKSDFNDKSSDSPDVEQQDPSARLKAQQNFSRYFDARGRGHSNYITEANKCDKFYRGDQWDDADLKQLEDAGRPAMTVNVIMSAVNSVRGEYSNKRADFRFKPKNEAGSVEQAEILNKVVMHAMDNTSYDDMEQEMFDDGIITDRGYLDVRINNTDNLQGEIVVESRDPRSVIPDPDASGYDPKTWRDVIITQFMSLDEIAFKYGLDKAREIKNTVALQQNYAEDSIDFKDGNTFGDDDGVGVNAFDGNFVGDPADLEQNKIKGVRVVDRQHWQYGTFKHFLDPVMGDTRPVALDWSIERAKAFAERMGLVIIDRQERRVRWTVSADKVLLFDEWSPYETFTIIPFYPNFRRGKPVGMVRNLLNAQEIVNKSTSQMLHIVNTTANSGWIIETGSLVNMTVDDLANAGSQTGVVLEVAPNRKPPEKIKPNSVPTGLHDVSTRAADSVFEISGINRALTGQEKTSVSGISLENRQARGLAQLEPIFNNLARTRRMVGKKALELIQKFYTDERVFMISDYRVPESAPSPVPVNAQVQDEQGRITIENDLTLGEYGVVIGSMPAKDVYSEVQFAEALSLREAGIEIPDYRIINFSNLDDKTEIAQESQQRAGLAPPTEEEAEMQQIEQEVQMQAIQMQLETTAADIDLKRAQARLAEAKAFESADSPVLEREKLQLEAQITAIEQATRERVNTMKELSNRLSSAQTNNTKLEVEKRRALGNIATETLRSTNAAKQQQETSITKTTE